MDFVKKSSQSSVRCGIVLAGGEGKRLQSFIHQLRGDSLPKQYVRFIGNKSMLEHTFLRAETLIPPDRLFTVVSQNHLKYQEVLKQVSGRPKGTVILQPENRETAPGILLPLMHLYKHYPESVVVVFPSDHFIMENEIFMKHVDIACCTVEREPSQLVLLGVAPHGPETEYGYVVPKYSRNESSFQRVSKVLRFIEKPEPPMAQNLVQRGALWNTMVIAFKAKTLLGLVRKVIPSLYESFHRILKSLGTAWEADVVNEVYGKIKPVNFSSHLLEAVSLYSSSHLAVIPVYGVYWSDWGSEKRITKTLRDRLFIGNLTSKETA
jgi:mannose-1-phosphate guanylyltransferase